MPFTVGKWVSWGGEERRVKSCELKTISFSPFWPPPLSFTVDSLFSSFSLSPFYISSICLFLACTCSVTLFAGTVGQSLKIPLKSIYFHSGCNDSEAEATIQKSTVSSRNRDSTIAVNPLPPLHHNFFFLPSLKTDSH